MRSKLALSPIVRKELQGRMRGARAYVVLTIYLLIAAGLAMLVYANGVVQSEYDPGNKGRVGRAVFYIVLGIQIGLVCIIAPAATSGAIIGEHERQTYEILLTTLLTPFQIAWGKLASALGFLGLLVFASLPLAALSYLMGGIQEEQLIIGLPIIIASALLFSTLGLYISARAKTTLGAVVITFVLVLAILVGIPLLIVISVPLLRSWADPRLISGAMGMAPPPTNMFDPIAILMWIAVSLNPVLSLVISLESFQGSGDLWLISASSIGPTGYGTEVISPFIAFTAISLLLSALFFWLTVRRIRRSAKA
jgi:ABC-type transport system involved in multi-copper enzyme maturation permease subunit